MQIEPILRALRDLEQAAADLYGFYAEIFSDNSEARQFFLHMQKQEIKHRDIVEFEHRLVMGNSDSFGEVPIDDRDIRKVIESIEQHISEGIFDIRDAFDFALELEESAVESFYKTALAQSNPKLQSMIDHLTEADSGHVKQLKNFASRVV